MAQEIKTIEQAIAECIERDTHVRQDEREPRCETCPGEVFEATVIACERKGGHVVYPSVWPPQNPDGATTASVPLRCDRCGTWLIVYDRPMKGVKVMLPPAPDAPARAATETASRPAKRGRPRSTRAAAASAS